MSAIAERPATGNHQDLKGRQQQQECLPRATTVTPEQERKEQQEWKQQQDRRHSMDAIKSRDACKNSEAGNSNIMEGGQQQQRQ